MASTPGPDWEKLSIYISPELAQRLRQHYADTRLPMSRFVRDLVEAHFARRDARLAAAKAKGKPPKKRARAAS